MKPLLLLLFLPIVVIGQPTFGPYPIPGNGGGGATNGQTAAQVATLINDTNVNRIQPVVDGKLAITNSYLKTNGNGSAVTALSGGNITAASIPITAADSSWASRTNFYNVTNATVGGAVVLVGPDANSNWYLKGTNWPSGGGSQTPWTSDINGGGFALTNAGSIRSLSGSVSLIPTNASVFGSVAVTIAMGTKLTNTWGQRSDVEIIPVYNDVIGGAPLLNYKRGTSTTNFNITFNPFSGISANASFTNQPLVIVDFGTNEWFLLTDLSTTTATVTIVTNIVHLK